MILGVGIDLVDIGELERLIDASASFVDATYTADELAYARSASGEAIDHLAARFAAKEAAVKALDGAARLLDLTVPGVSLRDVEVQRDARGRPSLLLGGPARQIADALEIARAHLSLTHDGNFAAAVVVLEK